MKLSMMRSAVCPLSLPIVRCATRRWFSIGQSAAACWTSGRPCKLRSSDLVMYDRQTESWWQQFTGDAIVGTMTGERLRLIPSRLELFGRFRQRFPDGQVLVPNDPGARRYGENPYVGYDASGRRPFLYDGSLPNGVYRPHGARGGGRNRAGALRSMVRFLRRAIKV